MSKEENTKIWNDRAQVLVGKTIKETRYMTDEEAEKFDWYKKPLIIIFTDGTYIMPMMDDEGNNGGSLEGSKDELSFPTLNN